MAGGCSGVPAMSYPRRPRNAVVDHVSTLARVVELLLPAILPPIEAPCYSSSFSLPGCAATSFGLSCLWRSGAALRYAVQLSSPASC